MRILVVHNRYRSSVPSGENRVVDQEHEALTEAGHEVVRFERDSDDIEAMPAHRKALVPLQVLWSPGTGRALEDVIDRVRPDVAHVHNLFPLLGPSVLTSCARRRVPAVVTFHNYRLVCPGSAVYRTGAVCRDCVDRRVALPGLRHGCYRGSAIATAPVALSSALHRKLWRTLPSAYLFLSEAHRRELAPLGLPPERSFVKANFVAPAERSATRDDQVVYLGRLTASKGLRVLMDAWDLHSRRDGPALRLAIAGAGPLESEVRAWSRTRPTVEFLGLLDRSACADLVARSKAVVAPSEWPEPFGLAVAEAMAAGVPAVASAHGSFTDMISDGVNGFLYPPGDPAALAAVLNEIVRAPDSRLEEVGQEARRTYERRFTKQATVAALEAVYSFVLAHPRHGAKQADPAAAGPVYQAPA